MKEYIIKVNKNKIESPNIKLVENDYNSTKFIFEFDFESDYKKVFQMRLPSGATWIKEIINNQLILVDENNTETVPVLVENGLYEFDIAIYDDNSKLTTTDSSYFNVRSAIQGENVELDDRVPVLDDLINEVETLDIDIENSIITITKKDGTIKTANVKGEKGDAGSIKFIIASELPTENIDDSAIYMIPAGATSEGNTYEEYIYVNGVWESLGSASVNVDLADYVKNTDYATATKAGVIKVSSTFGMKLNEAGELYYISANMDNIRDKNTKYRVLTPYYIDHVVKSGLANCKLEWTEEEKASARELLGGHVTLSQAEYEALETVDENTFYYITEE